MVSDGKCTVALGEMIQDLKNSDIVVEDTKELIESIKTYFEGWKQATFHNPSAVTIRYHQDDDYEKGISTLAIYISIPF